MTDSRAARYGSIYLCIYWQPVGETPKTIEYTYVMSTPDTLFKRQAMRHACLPSLLADGDKCTVGKKYFVLGRLEQSMQDKNLFYCHDEPSKPTKEGPLSYVLLESPFVSVSAVSWGHPSKVSMVYPACDLFRF
jgi:hypothetical protein